MFSAIHSSALGKSNCGCAKGNPYTPSITSTMDVSFQPIKNSTGSVNYVALIENDETNKNITSLFDKNTEDTISDTSEINDSTNTNDIFSLDNDYVKTFYIGSITVIGLYILFRILDKTK
jgi:hypothetical protein